MSEAVSVFTAYPSAPWFYLAICGLVQERTSCATPFPFLWPAAIGVGVFLLFVSGVPVWGQFLLWGVLATAFYPLRRWFNADSDLKEPWKTWLADAFCRRSNRRGVLRVKDNVIYLDPLKRKAAGPHKDLH